MSDKQYVSGAPRRKLKHPELTQEQINELFVKVGWIGERRQPVLFIKAVPYIEKGLDNSGR